MGLVPSDATLALLSHTPGSWWKEPKINFMIDWLNRVPLSTLQRQIARLSSHNPSELRLRILIALRLGFVQEAEYLSRSSILSSYDLEDAAVRAEVLLSAKQPCAARNALNAIFPPRTWSVRLSEIVNKIPQACHPDPYERFISSKIQKLVWSKETESWMREMCYKLNQRILMHLS